jgi:hypothetical protein
MTDEICGHCGKPMILREVAPCLVCGGNPNELEHLKSGQHYFLKVGLFGGEILCDFCHADMPSTDPSYWGFPPGFDWDKNLYSPEQEMDSEEIIHPHSSQEMVCPNEKCHNTLRKQHFIVQNAKRNGITLPGKYWSFLKS